MNTFRNLHWLAVLGCLAGPLTGLAQDAALITSFTNRPPAVDRFYARTVAALGGDRVLIGGLEGAGQTPAVYLFSTNGTLLATCPAPSPAADGQDFGASLAALGSDRVLVGALVPPSPTPGDWKPDAAYLFSTNGALLATLAHPHPTPGNYDFFGCALAPVGNDRVLIGASGTDLGGFGAGAAYLLNASGALLTAFTSPTPTAYDSFGVSVAALGSDRVLIGAPRHDAGAAYLFGTNGALLAVFTNPTPAANDRFGQTVAALGSDRVLIGAPGADLGADDAGAVYLFGTNGALLTAFTNPTPEYFDSFGEAVVAVGNDRVLIGAPYDNTGASRAGTAYLFGADGTLLATFANPRPTVWANFGSPLAAVGSDRVLIAAGNAGAAYLFSASAPVYWRGGEGVWSDATKWSPAPPKPASHVIIPPGSSVSVDVAGAQTGGLTVQTGGRLTVQPGASLVLNGPAVNNGTFTVGGDVISYAAGNAFVQNGTLYIKLGVAMRGFDSGGRDFAFIQTGGATTVDGTLDWGKGIIYMQAGMLQVQREAAMRGFDSDGKDLAFVQTGGRVTIDGTFETSNAGLRGGTMNGGGTLAGNLLNDGGTLAPGASPGTFTITGDYVQTNSGTLRMEVAGRDAGQFDQLRVGGTALLGGTLTVTLLDSFAPDLRERFPFLVCTNLSGTFSNLTMPAGIILTNTNTGVTPVVTGKVPTTILGPVLSGGNAMFTFGTVTNRSYVVESAGDAAAPAWAVFTNLTGTGAKVQVSVPCTSATRRFFRVRQP